MFIYYLIVRNRPTAVLIKINLAKINLSSFMAIRFRFRVMVDAFNKPVKI